MKWTLGGYVQARYTDDQGEGAFPVATDIPGTFRDVRPSVLVRATDEEHVFLQFFFSSPDGNKVEVQHAFAQYEAAPYYGRLGLGPVPFGYENPITSAALVTTERSMASATLIGKTALDRGVYFLYQPSSVFIAKPAPGKPGTVNVELGLVNGQPYDVGTDTNNTKNFAGRVGLYIPKGEIGVSVISGKGVEPTDPTTRDRFGADLQWRPGPFIVLAEYMRGKGNILTTGSSTTTGDALEANGGYVTLAYRPLNADGTPKSYQVYVRGDVLDRDVDAAGDYFSRATYGACYYLNPTSKVQAELENIKDSRNPDLDGRITLQYQIIF